MEFGDAPPPGVDDLDDIAYEGEGEVEGEGEEEGEGFGDFGSNGVYSLASTTRTGRTGRTTRREEEDEEDDEVGDRISFANTTVETTTSRAIANKIRFLSKKNRELTASLNGEKSRNNGLTKKVGELEYKVMKLERDVARAKRGKEVKRANSSTSNADRPSTNGNGKGKIINAQQSEEEQKKLHEYRTEIASLKHDLQRAHRALEMELGDDVPVNLVLQGDTKWQGRAQQISRLKAKVSDLQSQLRGTSSRSTSTYATLPKNKSDSAVDRGRQAIQQMEEKRRANIEELKIEHEKLTADMKTLKEKYDACRSRNRTITKELKEYKKQYEQYHQTHQSTKFEDQYTQTQTPNTNTKQTPTTNTFTSVYPVGYCFFYHQGNGGHAATAN
eukprot:m.8890 g.8890  ORF g.8890 m.8890 type:complete len:387 (+) comp6242_c0_seq1:65-1225(+)